MDMDSIEWNIELEGFFFDRLEEVDLLIDLYYYALYICNIYDCDLFTVSCSS